MARTWYPCNDCCSDGCQIFEDKFNRADDTDIGSDWSEEAGDWEINLNHLETSDTSAIASCQTSGTDLAHTVEVKITPQDDGDIFRIIVNYQDTSNYHYLEWTADPSVGTFNLYKKVGGTETLLKNTAWDTVTSVQRIIRVCYAGETLYASVYASNTNLLFGIFVGGIGPATVATGAVGTGGTLTSDAVFDDFILYKSFAADAFNCPPCNSTTECNSCTQQPEELSLIMEIEITGMVNLDPVSCTTCDNVNAVYIMQPLIFQTGLGGACHYHFDLDDADKEAFCGIGRTNFTILGDASPNCKVSVFFSGIGTWCSVGHFFQMTWRVTGHPPCVFGTWKSDCDFVDFDLPYFSGTLCCDGTNTTCTVNSL